MNNVLEHKYSARCRLLVAVLQRQGERHPSFQEIQLCILPHKTGKQQSFRTVNSATQTLAPSLTSCKDEKHMKTYMHDTGVLLFCVKVWKQKLRGKNIIPHEDSVNQGIKTSQFFTTLRLPALCLVLRDKTICFQREQPSRESCNICKRKRKGLAIE